MDTQFAGKRGEWTSSVSHLHLPLKSAFGIWRNLSLPRTWGQTAMKTNSGYEEGRAKLLISCISLVADNSVCSHGSNLSISTVSKGVRALRHLHLKRQWTQGETELKWASKWPPLWPLLGHCPARASSPLNAEGLCHDARSPAAWRCIWALYGDYGCFCLLTRRDE